MKPIRVIINSRSRNLAGVTSKLKEHGLKVTSVLDGIGVITGEIDQTKLESLKRIQDITVEREGSVQIPPPDAPLQ